MFSKYNRRPNRLSGKFWITFKYKNQECGGWKQHQKYPGDIHWCCKDIRSRTRKTRVPLDLTKDQGKKEKCSTLPTPGCSKFMKREPIEG